MQNATANLNSRETVEILNDLIRINNDRIDGYEKALKELKDDDADLKDLFLNMIAESQNIRMALGVEAEVLGGDMEKGTTAGGKIYRAWIDVKAVFTGHNRHSILESCEFGEDAAQKAYQTALETEGIPAFIRDMISNQKEDLLESHDEIRELRNQTA
jgi:uncharacterized protein (TIGR02284 family)